VRSELRHVDQDTSAPLMRDLSKFPHGPDLTSDIRCTRERNKARALHMSPSRKLLGELPGRLIWTGRSHQEGRVAAPPRQQVSVMLCLEGHDRAVLRERRGQEIA
jgi:hypothetical protein